VIEAPVLASTVCDDYFRVVQKLPAKLCLHLDLRVGALGSNSLAGNFRHYWSNLGTRR
jgi:hypothetical protein